MCVYVYTHIPICQYNITYIYIYVYIYMLSCMYIDRTCFGLFGTPPGCQDPKACQESPCCSHLGISRNQGPYYRPQICRALILIRISNKPALYQLQTPVKEQNTEQPALEDCLPGAPLPQRAAAMLRQAR